MFKQDRFCIVGTKTLWKCSVHEGKNMSNQFMRMTRYSLLIVFALSACQINPATGTSAPAPTSVATPIPSPRWGWEMVYRHAYGLNYATSTDGVQWIIAPRNPIILLSGKDVWYSSFVVHDDVAFLFFEAGRATSSGTSSSTYLATWAETRFR